MKIIIGIDVDFEGYEPFTKHYCKFNKKRFEKNLLALIDFLKEYKYPAVFFIHTSPYIRNNFNNIFYTDNFYLKIWKDLINSNFEIGFHPHEEDENGKYYLYYVYNYMKNIFDINLKLMADNGIKINSIRTGFFSFNEWLIPLCEKYNIKFSFDNMGAYQPLTNTHFENAPYFSYFYDYIDKEKIGNSKIYSIPLGFAYNYTLWQALIPEANKFSHIKKLWDIIISMEDKKYWVCNLLIHSYNFLKKKKIIKKTLEYISKNKGEFILTRDVSKEISI
ncbi:MAG TPA: hypothetical protein PLD27_10495 [bacterium]|nr:hypothetical protein [bacterium]HOL47646.1 hypothetical protein [bacterium]HPQ19642.1 hypothetical protein [bacterium]